MARKQTKFTTEARRPGEGNEYASHGAPSIFFSVSPCLRGEFFLRTSEGPRPISCGRVMCMICNDVIATPLISKIRTPHRFVAADFLGGTGDNDAAGFQQIGVIGEVQRERCVLLDQQDA